jgi:hypothetical protein
MVTFGEIVSMQDTTRQTPSWESVRVTGLGTHTRKCSNELEIALHAALDLGAIFDGEVAHGRS